MRRWIARIAVVALMLGIRGRARRALSIENLFDKGLALLLIGGAVWIQGL